MIPPSYISDSLRACAAKHFKARMEAQRATRMSWWSHWAQLAEMLLPRRYKWFITPNQYNRGSQVNASIVDETGVLAARNLASGMMSGLTSPTRPWFRLGLHGMDDIAVGPTSLWLAEVERRMMRVFAESNLYQSLAVFYHDLAVFGTAAQLIYEDPNEVIRCYNPCLGEFFFSSSARLDVDCFYREYTYTIAQAAEAFGKENLSPPNRQAYENGGAQLENEIVICHAIEPNTQFYDESNQPAGYLVAPMFKFREAYWEQSASGDCNFLSLAGYVTKPFNAGRWNVTSNDPYASDCPGMSGLPAVRQLQIQARRKAEAIDKMVRPPMNASLSMKNEPASILPGAINYVADLQSSGFKPAYQVDPRIQELAEDIKDTQARVGSIFYNDLFLMISQLDTVRSATEIDARREEKLIMLGPVIERFENEVLDPTIDRVYDIMSRRGLLPPPPPEIQGMEINVQYISMLAEAQRAAATTAIERLTAYVGSIGAVKPEAYDTIKWDDTIEEYAELLSVPPKLLASIKEIMALRQQRAQQESALATAQIAQAGADGAKTLSETDVGGGQNALQMMLQ